MYSRVLTHEDAEEFYRLEGVRLPDIQLGDRQPVVIRFFAPRESRDQFGMEYGAILYRNPRNGKLSAQIELEATGERKHIPLEVRSDGILVSLELQPRRQVGVRMGFTTIIHPAHDGQPSRPYGYILPEEYAAELITDDPEVLRLIAA